MTLSVSSTSDHDETDQGDARRAGVLHERFEHDISSLSTGQSMVEEVKLLGTSIEPLSTLRSQLLPVVVGWRARTRNAVSAGRSYERAEERCQVPSLTSTNCAKSVES